MLAKVAIICGLVGIAAFPVSGLAAKGGLLPPLSALYIAAPVTLGGGVLAIATAAIAFWRGRRGLPGGVLGVLSVALMVYWFSLATHVPWIHDVSTDLKNPPVFTAILAERTAEHANSLDPSEAVAALQKSGYPDIGPLMLKQPPADVFPKALADAKSMGWKIVLADAASGRIEATDQTFWMGFKDDIAVRVAAADGGTRVDVRSVSRVGESDFGVNAKRIRAYFARLQ